MLLLVCWPRPGWMHALPWHLHLLCFAVSMLEYLGRLGKGLHACCSHQWMADGGGGSSSLVTSTWLQAPPRA